MDEAFVLKLLGVMIAVVAVLIKLIIFGIISGYLLSSIEAPTWIWVLFWIYIPLEFAFGILGVLVKTTEANI